MLQGLRAEKEELKSRLTRERDDALTEMKERMELSLKQSEANFEREKSELKHRLEQENLLAVAKIEDAMKKRVRETDQNMLEQLRKENEELKNRWTTDKEQELNEMRT